jgi:hypothetical protein
LIVGAFAAGPENTVAILVITEPVPDPNEGLKFDALTWKTCHLVRPFAVPKLMEPFPTSLGPVNGDEWYSPSAVCTTKNNPASAFVLPGAE